MPVNGVLVVKKKVAREQPSGGKFLLFQFSDRTGTINGVMWDGVDNVDVVAGDLVRVEGEGVFARLKYESGVHRVQRVPETEAGGRIHTSAATVAVLPEAEEVDVRIDPSDLRIDTMRSSGAGGQHVNTTDSAVRITHLPTGIVVTSSQKSQHRNRDEAWQMLRSRLYEHEMRKRTAEQQKLEDSKTDVGWGHQIRSYVLDQSRIKDLRTNVEVSNTQKVLDGDLDVFINASLKQGL